MSRWTQVAPDWAERLAAAGLSDAQRLLDDELPPTGGTWTRLSKPGLRGRERWRWGLPDGPTLYLKRYLRTPLREQWDRMQRQVTHHSRAWWEHFISAELARQYIPAVRAVAGAERMRGRWELRSAVLFEAAAGDALDRSWSRLERGAAGLTRGRPRHQLTRSLARFVSAFHQTGTCHRDLYLCHVFADLTPGAAAPPRFTLIDLARTHRPRLRRMRWLIKDLAQLDVSARQIGGSRADRLRFLVTYLGLLPDSPRVRWFARRVAAKSARILRRIARRAGRA